MLQEWDEAKGEVIKALSGANNAAGGAAGDEEGADGDSGGGAFDELDQITGADADGDQTGHLQVGKSVTTTNLFEWGCQMAASKATEHVAKFGMVGVADDDVIANFGSFDIQGLNPNGPDLGVKYLYYKSNKDPRKPVKKLFVDVKKLSDKCPEQLPDGIKDDDNIPRVVVSFLGQVGTAATPLGFPTGYCVDAGAVDLDLESKGGARHAHPARFYITPTATMLDPRGTPMPAWWVRAAGIGEEATTNCITSTFKHTVPECKGFPSFKVLTTYLEVDTISLVREYRSTENADELVELTRDMFSHERKIAEQRKRKLDMQQTEAAKA